MKEIFPNAGADKDLYRKIILRTGYFVDREAYLDRWKAYKLTVNHSMDLQKKADELRKKAQGKDEREFKWIQAILETGILVAPKNYLAQWYVMRGGTEELRMPEDRVMHFFSDELIGPGYRLKHHFAEDLSEEAVKYFSEKQAELFV